MMDSENTFLSDVKGWISRPFIGPLSPMVLMAMVGVFVVLLWIVLDRQDIIRQAQTLVDAA